MVVAVAAEDAEAETVGQCSWMVCHVAVGGRRRCEIGSESHDEAIAVATVFFAPNLA